MPLHTGFEGYCDACAEAFGETVALIDDPGDRSSKTIAKVRFGEELFGISRFSEPNMRHRTWQLKGTATGARNRFSVFQEVWLHKTKDLQLELRDLIAIEEALRIIGRKLEDTERELEGTDQNLGEIESMCREIGNQLSRSSQTLSEVRRLRNEQGQLADTEQELGEIGAMRRWIADHRSQLSNTLGEVEALRDEKRQLGDITQKLGDPRQELDNTKQELEGAEHELVEIGAMCRWIGDQRSKVSRVLRIQDATKDTYVSEAKRLLRSIEKLLAPHEKVAEENVGSKSRKNCISLSEEQRKWLEALSSSLASVATKDVTLTPVRNALTTAKDELAEKERSLAARKADLEESVAAIEHKKEKLEKSLPEKAVSACVDTMLATENSLLWHAMHKDKYCFANSFCADVVPAIEEGFHAEAYPEERVDNFRRQMDDYINQLAGARDDSVEQFREFLITLVSSLVYGPECAGAGATTGWEETFEPTISEPNGMQILLTQLFTEDGRYLGKARLFNSDDIIFMGRSGNLEEYEEKCKAVLDEEGDAESILKDRVPRLFTIAEDHGQVSNLHGAIYCEDGTWRYLDFSRFGTRIVGRGKGESILSGHYNNQYRELMAGNTLYLGALPNDVGDTRLYRKAAAVKLSFFLDEYAVSNSTL